MIVDAHTDVLWKMLKEPDIDFYQEDKRLDLHYPNMLKGNIGVQVFAIFVSTLKTPKFLSAIQSIDDFYEKIIKDGEKIQAAACNEQLRSILENGKKAAILSLEGAEAMEGDLSKLRILYRLGVRAMGLTWNFANEVGDGVAEERNGGLTLFGKEVVQEMNRLKMIVDISHLSERGFWDVLSISSQPIIASHSNAKAVHDHPRNLTDDQIKAIINRDGIIGMTYVKDFISQKEEPTVDDLLLHIEHIADLGGIKHIGLGSDFDGGILISELNDAGKLDRLAEALYLKYTNEMANGILGENWLRFYKSYL